MSEGRKTLFSDFAIVCAICLAVSMLLSLKKFGLC